MIDVKLLAMLAMASTSIFIGIAFFSWGRFYVSRAERLEEMSFGTMHLLLHKS